MELLRVSDERRHTASLEALLEDFELAPGRYFLPIDDGDLRRLGGSTPVGVTREQGLEKFLAEGVAPHVKFGGKLRHHGKIAKNFGKRFGVTQTGGRFGIVFGEFQGIG